MYYCYLDTPIGELLVAGDDDGVGMVGFPEGSMRREPEPDWIFNERELAEACRQLSEYFAGQRKRFELKLNPSGTEFQRQVLEITRLQGAAETLWRDRQGPRHSAQRGRPGLCDQPDPRHHPLPPGHRRAR